MTMCKSRINKNVTLDSETGCWMWARGKDRYGYGYIKCPGIRLRAHRYAYEAFVGPIPDGMFVCHRCDVRACVNPEHLFIGTHRDNMADCATKGRNVHGERHPGAKLSQGAVAKIFALRAQGASQSKIAARFGVSQQLVSRVLMRQCWRSAW